MTEYKPTSRCPNCGRCPSIRFHEGQVALAKRERQAANVISMQCERCRSRYWIRAREIANAQADGLPELPADFPERDALTQVGIRTVEELVRIEDLTSLPGIGPARAKRIALKLDRMRGSAVA